MKIARLCCLSSYYKGYKYQNLYLSARFMRVINNAICWEFKITISLKGAHNKIVALNPVQCTD